MPSVKLCVGDIAMGTEITHIHKQAFGKCSTLITDNWGVTYSSHIK
jgi:hypothetical protein